VIDMSKFVAGIACFFFILLWKTCYKWVIMSSCVVACSYLDG